MQQFARLAWLVLDTGGEENKGNFHMSCMLFYLTADKPEEQLLQCRKLLQEIVLA